MAKAGNTEKKKRGAAKGAQESGRQDRDGGIPENDPMSECVSLCQKQRWREAAKLCMTMRDKAANNKKHELNATLAGALVKIEYSLRRQMAAAFVSASNNLLAKEFLLDVAGK